MKLTMLFGCTLSLAPLTNLSAADGTQFSRNARQVAETLPHGSIVMVEQNGGEAPFYSAAGKLEPAGVAPEKIIFEIGSISKVFTGILLAQAIEEKKVTLDTTLRDLMGKGQHFADKHVAAITLKQLAIHTSGLPRIPDDLSKESNAADPYAHYDRAHLNAFIAQTKLPNAGPFPSSYSNLGVGLLGDLLARLYGKSWEELVIERITKPLAMKDTCVTLNEEQKRRLAPPYSGGKPSSLWNFASLAGAGALRSTASDMLIFGQALAHPESTPLKTSIEMTEQPIDNGPIGLCLQVLKVNGRNSCWFAGGTGGFRSWISARPADGRIVVILINNSALSPEAVMMGQASK